MILALAATEFEMNPLLNALGGKSCTTLISGVEPVEVFLQRGRVAGVLPPNKQRITI